jgi:hypothetical protein
MSFALVHQSKNKATDDKTSTPATTSHYINNLAMDFHDSIIHLQRTIGNQDVQGLMHSDTGIDFAKFGIQSKLKISQPGDVYEQEADKVADQVMRMSIDNSITQAIQKDEERINRKCTSCEMKKEENEKLNISRKPSTASKLEANDEITNEINNIRSSVGSPLDITTKDFMESYFGYDFSNVRIHTNEMAARSSDSVNAVA